MNNKTDAIMLRLERKQERDTVEQITYRAFANAPPTGADDDGREALLARKLRTDPAFVPEFDPRSYPYRRAGRDRKNLVADADVLAGV